MDHFLNSFVSDNELSTGMVTVIGHVFLCALFSTFLWNWLYDAKCDFAFLWSSADDNTSLFSVPVLFLCLVVTFASAIALLMVFSWKRTVVFIIQLAHLCLLFNLPLNIFADFLDFVPIGYSLQLFLLFVLVFLYFTFGSLALFTDRISARVQRLLVVLNCSLITVILLRCFPHNTIWQIILLDIAWDSFSVLAGPVRKMFENSHEYGEKMVRCVLFSAEDEQNDGREETPPTAAAPAEANFISNAPGERNANDALGGVQLGLGDFVLFALLVARAWSDHPMGAAAALVGIAIGLIANFVVAFSYARKMDTFFFVPALPCPMLLGMGLHFGILFAIKMNPFLRARSARLSEHAKTEQVVGRDGGRRKQSDERHRRLTAGARRAPANQSTACGSRADFFRSP
ncbi:hypothetical protein niasHT_001130 [Heterodera trifolii]|uniref:Presenilin n=1 Tax=Heterodera trifolii TaxID=157864 RepID=A0ABD2LYK1_9BILA